MNSQTDDGATVAIQVSSNYGFSEIDTYKVTDLSSFGTTYHSLTKVG